MNIRFHFLLIFLFLIKPSFANNYWTGTGSIISHNTGANTGYGLTKDVAIVHPSRAKSPVVFFQWQLNSNDGNKLRINSANYTSATITYGYWNSLKKDRVTYAKTSLPFILDPSRDGLSNEDGTWFTIAVSLPNSPARPDKITATATNTNGTSFDRAATETIRLENSNYWGGSGSLISKSSGNLTGFSITEDVVMVEKDLVSTVFFQWEIDSSDGKLVKISSSEGCFNQVKITTGDWFTRAKDITKTVTLPYTMSTSKADGDWLLIRVDLLTKSLCQDYVHAKIVQSF